jgi:hypothetical protein
MTKVTIRTMQYHQKAQRWENCRAAYFRKMGKPENEAMCIEIANNHKESAMAAFSQCWLKHCKGKFSIPDPA